MKRIYDARKAEEAARARRTDSRGCPNMTLAELKDFYEQISCRLRLGQSVHHIFASSPTYSRSMKSRLIFSLRMAVSP